MDTSVSPGLRKWIRKRLRDEFAGRVRSELARERSVYSVAEELASSRELEALVESFARQSFREDYGTESRGGSTAASRSERSAETRRSASLSYGSDLELDDWSTPYKSPDDRYGSAVDKISEDKPVHVRLAGYETLLDGDSINVGDEETWTNLMRNLEQGICDESRPVFEASLRVHAKLLETPRSREAHENLIRSYVAQQGPRNSTTNDSHTAEHTANGINFKFFRHERLCRVMRLLLRHQEERLGTLRTVDKALEDSIEAFVRFLAPRVDPGTVPRNRSLEAASVLALLEPRAEWSARWIHGTATRRAFASALSRAPEYLQSVLAATTTGSPRGSSPDSLSLTIRDEPTEVFVSGETIETLVRLHALNLVGRLIVHAAERKILAESPFEATSVTFDEFSRGLVASLDALASTTDLGNAIYNVTRDAMRRVLERSSVAQDGQFYREALASLTRPIPRLEQIWPHTLDVLEHMICRKDALPFLVGDDAPPRTGSAEHGSVDARDDGDAEHEKELQPRPCPVLVVLEHIAVLLRQPFAVMNLDHVAEIFGFVGRAFAVREIRNVLETVGRKEFFPALAYLYGRMDKYAVGQEGRTQFLDSATKSMLLKIAASPLGLRLLANETTVFEQLIRGSIAPLRAPWNSSEILSFVSSAAYYDHGAKIINGLAPQSLSTALEEVSILLEDPHNFHDPWDNTNLDRFVHVLTCLSLSTRCFIAFMADSGYEDTNDEYTCPRTLRDLIKHSANIDSPYHYLGLLTIQAFVWNLDVYAYLLNFCDFQNTMLRLQELAVHDFDEDGDTRRVHVTDSCSLLRHRILTSCYYVRQRLDEPEENEIDDERVFFSVLPPPVEARPIARVPRATSPGSSELSELLENGTPGLRDNAWVLEVRRAYRNSPDPIKNSVLIDLLDQMQKAIPTAEWVDNFKWISDGVESEEKRLDWTDEENLCFEVVLRYAEENSPLANVEQAEADIKTLFREVHKFIGYRSPENFEGFDWFLATVFIVCGGNIDTSKEFVKKIIRFPAAMFMWPFFGLAIDRNNDEEMATQCMLGQHLEDVIDEELPTVNWALKNYCGVHWWMICSRLMSQCFWGLLPWTEIVHFFALCILNSADYVVYYCASLLHHCQERLTEDIANKKMWPDNMYFGDYRCHHQMAFIDRIGKRYRNRVLPTMSQRKLVTSFDQQ